MRLMRWLAPIGLLALLLLSACGKNPSGSTTSKQPVDPRTAPTATVPAVLPSPIAAIPVSIGTSPAGVPAASGTNGQPDSYTVKAGDTLSRIAAKLGVSLQALESYNTGVQPSDLHVGQSLKVPPAPSATAPAQAGTIAAAPSSTPASAGGIIGASTYTVRSGDTACKIAAAHQISLQELAEANGKSPASLASLKIGQTLKIPPATGSPRGC